MPRVLIADDNQFLRDTLKAVVFDRKNWTVCGEAADGGEAVEMAAKLHPDVILLDFQMPVMNGLRAAEKILTDSPAVPIILYTLHKNSFLETQAKSVGVRSVVDKVDSFSDLITSLESILGLVGSR
jgi:CheY-like chemotaxis protein